MANVLNFLWTQYRLILNGTSFEEQEFLQARERGLNLSVMFALVLAPAVSHLNEYGVNQTIQGKDKIIYGDNAYDNLEQFGTTRGQINNTQDMEIDFDQPANSVVEANSGDNNAKYKEVEIVNEEGKPLGEFDEIDLDERVFHEDKSAQGLSVTNPNTGNPYQTATQWADKQLYEKTKVRIQNINESVETRPTVNGSTTVPTLDEIKDIKSFNFRISADTLELREAVGEAIEKLSSEYPDYTFTVEYGAN